MVVISFWYKAENRHALSGFPIKDENKRQFDILIIIFFSKKSCPECLEIINILNGIRHPFKVKGVIPDDEFNNVNEVRRITGALFPLYSFNRFKRFQPGFIPSLMLVSQKGTIYSILPIIPEINIFFYQYLEKFHHLLCSFGLFDKDGV